MSSIHNHNFSIYFTLPALKKRVLIISFVRIYDNRFSMAKHNAISLQDFDNGMPCFIISNQIINYEQSVLKTRQTETHFAFYHNTVVNCDNIWQYQTYFALYGISKNNLFVSANGGRMWDFQSYTPNWKTNIDYNAFDSEGHSSPFRYGGTSYSGLDSYSKASGLDNHSIEVNKDLCFENLQISGPSPTSAPLQYLDLKSGCGAIDAGVVLPNINDGYLGNAPDIGAYEFGAALPHYGPRGGSQGSCTSRADLPPYDNAVSINELINIIGEWKAGSVSIADVINAIGEWKDGCR